MPGGVRPAHHAGAGDPGSGGCHHRFAVGIRELYIATRRRVPLPLALAAAAVVLAVPAVALLVSTSGERGPGCDRVASPAGSDSARGSLARPLASAQALVRKLKPGQTGCLREGLYDSAVEIKFETPGTTLRSFPGERATIRGRIWVTREADGTVLEDLDLDGRNPRDLPSPTVNADDVVLRGNDITNAHTTICLSLGSADTFGRARRTLVESNAIHDCGELPPTNRQHGIYVNSADDAVIRDNLIYDNADRGIQLYPDAQGTLISGNVIVVNGQGVIFGGGPDSASSGNIVEGNLISGSRVRHNIEASWGGPVGTGNIARDNCVFGGARGDIAGGIQEPAVGFTATGNGGPSEEDGPCAGLTP